MSAPTITMPELPQDYHWELAILPGLVRVELHRTSMFTRKATPARIPAEPDTEITHSRSIRTVDVIPEMLPVPADSSRFQARIVKAAQELWDSHIYIQERNARSRELQHELHEALGVATKISMSDWGAT